ncbi:hypothetical protein [Nonomuraea rubra]|uniref:hypothetical protein n=1 Tax=Nonomuraea rubra TaxID=46180 RepID=UPI0033E52E77
MPVLLRYALYTLLALAGLAALLWLGWQIFQAIAEVVAALLFVMALAVMGAG